MKGCPWDEWTRAYAAREGRLGVLQWARSQGCPWDKLTCSYAASRGHLEVPHHCFVPIAISPGGPLFAALTHVHLPIVTHFQMASSSSIGTYLLIKGTALASRPLQHLQMTTPSSIGTCPLIPGTTLASRPFKDLCVTIVNGIVTHFQMASFGSNCTDLVSRMPPPLEFTPYTMALQPTEHCLSGLQEGHQQIMKITIGCVFS